MSQTDLKFLAFILKSTEAYGITLDMTEMRLQKLPSGNTGGGTFSDCDALVKVILPYSLVAIGDWTFSDCYNLEALEISQNLISIGDHAFDGCRSLASISYGGTKDQWTGVLLKTGEGNDALTTAKVICSDGVYSVWLDLLKSLIQ